MNYKRLSVEELNTYPYPNLIAEIIESGYGMHTISDYMGHGNTYDTQELIGKKLTGEKSILISEAFGLARLYGVKMEYLFAHTLSVMDGKPEAYWRWMDKNQRKDEEMRNIEKIWGIYRELNKKPYLIDFIKQCVALTEQQRTQVSQLLQGKGI